MTYLVDASVQTEPTRPAPALAALDWLREHEREIVVDPIILGEIRFGILLLRNGKKRGALQGFVDEGIRRLRCLSWDLGTGLRWAELIASLRRSRRSMPIKDSLIAAAGVDVVDPFGG